MSASVILLLLGPAVAQQLVDPCPEVDLDVAADDAVRAVTDDELGFARDLATTALEKVASLSRVADPEDLATLFQARAASGFYADPQQECEGDLIASSAIYPGWFNTRLGSELQEAWVSSSEGALAPATLSVGPIPDGGVLYVDGHRQVAQVVELVPGLHLVQVSVGAEVAWAWTGVLAPGEHRDLASGLPEPTPVRLVRDNPLLWGGLALTAGTWAGAIGVWSYGDTRFSLDASGGTFYDAEADPVAALDRDWRRFRLMEGGVVVGGVAATALLTSHVILKLRARRGD